jgi:hypothetical protein
MTTAMVRCTQPGCDGTIQDGYGTTCGLAAARRTPAPVPASGSAGSARSARGRLGAGLVDLPPVAYRDPASAILVDPQVAEGKRFCGTCDQPVGRSRGGRPGLADGFCRDCGPRFSFSPKLARDELVAGQYEVLGCLAHGRLGWIYLAKDRNVSDRWVVLKGLLNTADPDAMAAALAERRFLAEVEHPNVVRIYNFVQHADRKTGESAGYGRLVHLALDEMRHQQLTLEVLRAALDLWTSGQPAGGGPTLGCEPNARAVRFGLERTYRALARLTPNDTRGIELVDLANAIRPGTLT